LEFGADRPGDLNSLLKIATPDFAAITKIAPTHLHNFKTVENVAAEKVKLARAAKFFSILNFDDRELFEENFPAGIKFFGREKSCDLQISEIHETPTGFRFQLSGKFNEKNFTQKFTANFFGAFQISAFLPGIFFGLSVGISPEKIAEKFAEFAPPPGRGKILTGKNSTKIWDHSFNSSPAAARAVLQTLPQIPAARRIALLGEMKELGNFAEKFHREIARLAAGNCDFVVFVGAENFAKEFKNEIPPEKFHAEKTAENAGKFLKEFIAADDLILAKGSRAIRLEKAIAPLLENKNDAKKLAGEI
jgi:UDP-N-acetylmuramoyl-tripeptide--D-alanyl-D-alanine ligase